jgi:hypothetical protein
MVNKLLIIFRGPVYRTKGLGVMFNVKWRHPGAAIGLSLMMIMAGTAMADLPKIGVPAAVRPAAHGTPPGAEARILQVGLDLQANE